MPRKTATVLDEDGVEIGQHTITPIDLDTIQGPPLTNPPAVVTDTPVIPYTPPTQLLPYFTETVPHRIREAIASGTFLEHAAPVVLSSSVVMGIDLVNAVVAWFYSIVPVLLHAAETAAVVLVLIVLVTLLGRRPRGPKEIFVKGCPTKSPGMHRIKLK